MVEFWLIVRRPIAHMAISSSLFWDTLRPLGVPALLRMLLLPVFV
jgi:hypothetical protein